MCSLNLHCQWLMIMLCLASIALNVTSYSEYEQRYDNRRGAGQESRYYSGGGNGNRQQLSAQMPYQRPGGNYNQVDNDQQQPLSREYLVRAHETITDREHHKCRIWVPVDMVYKYPLANIISSDTANKLANIEVCCTGTIAIRHLGVTVCRPICGCLNGVCRMPGECDCFEGFVKNDNGDCVFACPLGCQNGRCFLDGSCQCDPGYTLDETRRFCRPICSSGCSNNGRHNCTEPETCSCAKGYQLTDNNGCQPVCDPDCGIGGLCRDNNICDCGAGYTLKDGVCQTDCYQKCNNGICVSRNRCICDPGFTYHEQSTICVPVTRKFILSKRRWFYIHY
ncbi:epidermal growth factor-like protein [Drosophila albomicans]|uniref:Epidermal growth factor-like protein n=1 Tax=Drosophila albomicans TaxID=7291 RepID=A0A6P8XK69_DROAB|nr:epidermal growth factor-like protein [Drosophila albomicans]